VTFEVGWQKGAHMQHVLDNVATALFYGKIEADNFVNTAIINLLLLLFPQVPQQEADQTFSTRTCLKYRPSIPT